MGEPLTKLYAFLFPNGKVYVGITQLPLSRRLAFHRKAKSGILRYALAKMEPEVVQLDQGPRNLMEQSERDLILLALSKPPGGYNICDGGEGFSSEQMRRYWSDPSFRAKASAAMRGPRPDVRPTACWEALKDPEKRRRWKEALSKGQTLHWSDPEARRIHGEKVRATWKRKHPCPTS